MRRSRLLHILGSIWIGAAFALMFPHNYLLSLLLTITVVAIFNVGLYIATYLGQNRPQSNSSPDLGEIIDQISEQSQQQDPIYVESKVETVESDDENS